VVGSPINDVFPGEIGAAALGMKVEIWDEDGHSTGDSGEKGDLVITKPFFSMPLTFYGQNGAEKYYNAYFKKFPGVWSHGDYIKKNPSTGGYEILGRSDGVLNPAGKRHKHSFQRQATCC
jgi:acetoacetyl-CoA synthetase